MHALLRPAAAMLLALLVSAPAFAQPRNATLRMTVADQTGAVIPGARVTVQPADGAGPPRETLTDAKGEAVFEDLVPGGYTVRAEFTGFETRQIDDLRLRAGSTQRDLRLPIGRMAEDVQVGQSGRERALDPRGDSFASVL